MKNRPFILLFVLASCFLKAQDYKTERIMESVRKHAGYKKALRRPLKATRVFVKEYTDTVFPNAALLQFKSLECLGVCGGYVYRNDSALAIVTRIDTIALKQFTQLRYLFLEGFDFSRFPEELCYMRQLKGLTLGLCKIKSIPPSIANLSELTYAEFRLNMLQALPPELFTLPKLEVLDVANNRLTLLPEGVLSLKALRKLNFSNVESASYVAAYALWPFEQNVNRIHYVAQYALLKKKIEAEPFEYFFLSVPTCFERELLDKQLTDDGIRKYVQIWGKACE